jgi:cytochrome P450
MADRRRNGLVTIAGQLESWVICEFAGSTINNVRWSKLAPEWAEQVGRDVLGLPLDAASQLEQKVFSQVIDDNYKTTLITQDGHRKSLKNLVSARKRLRRTKKDIDPFVAVFEKRIKDAQAAVTEGDQILTKLSKMIDYLNDYEYDVDKPPMFTSTSTSTLRFT